jgi:hypothetical protein
LQQHLDALADLAKLAAGGQCVGHGLDVRVDSVRVEGVEAIVHGAESDGVERQARKVVGEQHGGLGAEPRPLHDHLCRNVVHF